MKVICKVIFEATTKGMPRKIHQTTQEIDFYSISNWSGFDITYRFRIEKFAKRKEERVLVYESENKPFIECTADKQKNELVNWAPVPFNFNHYTGDITIRSNITKI